MSLPAPKIEPLMQSYFSTQPGFRNRCERRSRRAVRLPLQGEKVAARSAGVGTFVSTVQQSGIGDPCGCARCHFRPVVLDGGVSFPLTLALSRWERELASRVLPMSDVAPAATVHRAIQRRDARTTQWLRFAPARRAILPLPKGWGEGEASVERSICDYRE
jgi:hypothetical protein